MEKQIPAIVCYLGLSQALIIGSNNSKPSHKISGLGTKTVYDVVLADAFLVAQVTVTVTTSIAVTTRFEAVSNLAKESDVFVLGLCLVYYFHIVAICVHNGLLNILR